MLQGQQSLENQLEVLQLVIFFFLIPQMAFSHKELGSLDLLCHLGHLTRTQSSTQGILPRRPAALMRMLMTWCLVLNCSQWSQSPTQQRLIYLRVGMQEVLGSEG